MMKKNYRKFCKLMVLSSMIVALLALAGCGETIKHIKEEIVDEIEQGSKENPVNQIESLEVYCAAENEEHIYHVQYPYSFYTFSEEEMKCTSVDFTNIIEKENISEEDFTYFTEYIEMLVQKEDDGKKPQGDIAYRIICYYYDETGTRLDKWVTGYEVLPEGFEEFIERFNTICGGEYLTYSDTIQRVTPKFLTEVFGVTDEDVKDGTLQDVIDVMELDIPEVTDLYYMDNVLKGYYAETQEHLINPYRPYELQSVVESTQQEYDDFVEKYLEILGTDSWEERESDQDYLRYFYNRSENKSFYIGRTEDLEKMQIESPTHVEECYQISLDAHVEDMTYWADFIYSKDGKFILVDEADTDRILAFIELE